MGLRRIAPLVAGLIMICCFGMAASARAAATDGMLNLVPADWPIVVRYDATDATASGAYLSKAYSDPDLKKMSESFNLGLAKLLASLGIEVPVQPDLIPWTTRQAVVAANIRPDGQPQMLKVVSSKDAAAAEKWILDLSGSVFRNSEPRITDQSGARLIEWDIPELKIKPACAIGSGWVAFAESTATLKAAIADTDGPPAAAAGLAEHADDLLAFSIDGEALQKRATQGKGESEGAQAAGIGVLGGVKPHGGLSANENGFTLRMQSSVPLMTAMVLAAMVGDTVPGADTADLLPERSLAVVQLASGRMLRGLKEQMQEMAMGDQLGAAMNMASSMPDSPLAMAVTSLLPKPSFVVVAQASDAAAASEAAGRLKSSMQKMGLKLAPASGGLQQLNGKDSKLAGYIGAAGKGVFYATDLRSAKTLMQVSPATSLKTNDAYNQMQKLNGGPRLADVWVSLEGISALGYLYESMGADYVPLSKWMADSMKSTNGLGASAGMTDQGFEMRMSLRTQPGPASVITAVNTGLVAGTAAVLFPVFGRARGAARGSASLANLKQLAVAARMYTVDYGGRLPDPAKFHEQLMPYVGVSQVFNSPYPGYEYRMNPSLKGLHENQITDPASAILFYEINSDKTGDTPWESPDGMVRVVYYDGHAVQLPGAPAASQMKAGISPPGKGKPKK